MNPQQSYQTYPPGIHSHGMHQGFHSSHSQKQLSNRYLPPTTQQGTMSFHTSNTHNTNIDTTLHLNNVSPNSNSSHNSHSQQSHSQQSNTQRSNFKTPLQIADVILLKESVAIVKYIGPVPEKGNKRHKKIKKIKKIKAKN